MLLAAAAAFASLASTAGAAEVHFDPDSPAGKEYALPLDQAREEAAGVGKSDGPAGEKAPLFGEGVTPRSEAPDSGDVTSEERRESDNGGGAPADGTGSPGSGGGAASLLGATPDSSYPLSSGLLLIAAILLVGVGLGLGLKFAGRTSRPA